MDKREKEELAVATLFFLLLLWFLFHLFHKPKAAQQENQPAITLPMTLPNLAVNSLPRVKSGETGSCACEVKCQTSAFALPNTAQAISNLGNAANKQIVAAGNAVEQYLAKLAKQNNITVQYE